MFGRSLGDDVVRCRVRWDVGAERGGVFRRTGDVRVRERRDAATGASAGGYEGGAFWDDDDDDDDDAVEIVNATRSARRIKVKE